MSSLIHIKTWHLECSDTLPHSVPEQSEVIRLSALDCDAYAPWVAHIGNCYAKAQLYYIEEIISSPYRLSIIVPASINTKHKPQDPETKLERLEWFIENLLVPDCGLVISLYIDPFMMSDFQGPFGWDTLWQTKRLWKDSGSNYITLQYHTEMDHNSGNSTHRINADASIATIIEVAESCKYDIVKVDYTTPIDKLYNLLLESHYHFSYVGSSGYIAALARTPTLFFGAAEKIVKGHKTRYYDPHPDLYSKPNQEGSYTYPLSVWNHHGSNGGLTMQYDKKYKNMYLQNPDFYSISSDVDTIYQRTIRALLR